MAARKKSKKRRRHVGGPTLAERRAAGTLTVTRELAARDPRERGRVGLTPLSTPRRGVIGRRKKRR